MKRPISDACKAAQERLKRMEKSEVLISDSAWLRALEDQDRCCGETTDD